MKRLILVLLAVAAFCAPAFAADAPCGTPALPKACISLTSGGVTVATRDTRREYATVGVLAEGPLGAGFAYSVAVDTLAVQDGAGTDVGRAQAFRVVKADAGVAKDAGPFQFYAHGSVTMSVEGLQGAPVDPRQWDGLLDLRLPVNGGYIALRGGHDGAVGGWAGGVDVDIPVANAPSLVARYELPLRRDPTGRVPWVITAGVRVRITSFRIGK